MLCFNVSREVTAKVILEMGSTVFAPLSSVCAVEEDGAQSSLNGHGRDL